MERARNERYLALLTHAKSLSAAYVAVGHTEDDQAETVLMRLLRGTSVLGLASIQGVRADGVVRPLLRSSRAHVHGYANRIARELDVPIAYDPTNQDAKYLRTRTRALLNQLRTENGNVGKNLGRLAEEAHELRVWLELQAEVWCEQHVQEQGLPHRVWAALANPLRKSVVRHWCKKTFAIDLEHENLESIMKVRSSSDIPLAHDLRIRLRDGFICGVFSQTPNQVL